MERVTCYLCIHGFCNEAASVTEYTASSYWIRQKQMKNDVEIV